MIAMFYAYAYTWSFENKTAKAPSVNMLAFATVFFIISAASGIWGMQHFQALLPAVRKMKRAQIEQGIQSMQETLKQVIVVKRD